MATSLVDGPAVVAGSAWSWTIPLDFDPQIVPQEAELRSTVRAFFNAPDPPIATLRTGNGGIDVTLAGGKSHVTLHLSAAETRDVSAAQIVVDLWRFDLPEPVFLGVLATVPVLAVPTRQ